MLSNFIHLSAGFDMNRVIYDNNEFVLINTTPTEIRYSHGNCKKIAAILLDIINDQPSGSCDLRFFHKKTTKKRKDNIDRLCCNTQDNTLKYWMNVLLCLKLLS